jgi:hypothetical protein
LHEVIDLRSQPSAASVVILRSGRFVQRSPDVEILTPKRFLTFSGVKGSRASSGTGSSSSSASSSR